MRNSDCPKCQWSNGYSTCQDGSREAALVEHNRVKHPDHTHVFGPTPYDWERKYNDRMDTSRCYHCLARKTDFESPRV